MHLYTNDKVVSKLLLVIYLFPIFVNIEAPVPKVIFVSPFSKHWFANIDDCESPITPAIRILFYRIPSQSV